MVQTHQTQANLHKKQGFEAFPAHTPRREGSRSTRRLSSGTGARQSRELAVASAPFQATGYFTSPSPGTSHSSHLGLKPLLATGLLLPEPGASVCRPGPSAGAARAPGEPRALFLTSWRPLLKDALPPPRPNPASRTWRSAPPAQQEGETRQTGKRSQASVLEQELPALSTSSSDTRNKRSVFQSKTTRSMHVFNLSKKLSPTW